MTIGQILAYSFFKSSQKELSKIRCIVVVRVSFPQTEIATIAKSACFDSRSGLVEPCELVCRFSVQEIKFTADSSKRLSTALPLPKNRYLLKHSSSAAKYFEARIDPTTPGTQFDQYNSTVLTIACEA